MEILLHSFYKYKIFSHTQIPLSYKLSNYFLKYLEATMSAFYHFLIVSNEFMCEKVNYYSIG